MQPGGACLHPSLLPPIFVPFFEAPAAETWAWENKAHSWILGSWRGRGGKLGLFHDTGWLGPFLCPYVQIAVLRQLRQPGVTPPLSQQRVCMQGRPCFAGLQKHFSSGAQNTTWSHFASGGSSLLLCKQRVKGSRGCILPPLAYKHLEKDPLAKERAFIAGG